MRKYTLYYLLAFFLIAAVGISLSLTVFFKTAKIEVAGNTMYTDGELIETTGIEIGDNLLRMHPKQMARRLVEQYPYLETAVIRRTLPDTVTISVTAAEERAVLRDAATGRFAVLSAAGRALRTELPVAPQGTVPADGLAVAADEETNGETALVPLTPGDYLTESEKERFTVLLSLLDALEEQELSDDINVIDLRDPLEIRLLYRGRLAVNLGTQDDLDYKLRFTKTAIDREVTDETVGTLDVSQKPSARLREYDIYTADKWPFAPDLLHEYERRIVKDESWYNEAPSGEEPPAASAPAPAQSYTSAPSAPAAPAPASEAPAASSEAPEPAQEPAPQPPAESEAPAEPLQPVAPPAQEEEEDIIIVEEGDGEVIFVE